MNLIRNSVKTPLHRKYEIFSTQFLWSAKVIYGPQNYELKQNFDPQNPSSVRRKNILFSESKTCGLQLIFVVRNTHTIQDLIDETYF
jgi:hypothetical protein